MARRRKNEIDRIRVSGSTPFPIDMFRYDCCYPVSEPGSGIIADTIADNGIQHGAVSVDLFLRCGVRIPTVRRWESFGWAVDEAFNALGTSVPVEGR